MDGEIKWKPIVKVKENHWKYFFSYQMRNKSILNYLFIKDIVKQKGLENITVDELVQEITPKGRGKFKFVVVFKFNNEK